MHDRTHLSTRRVDLVRRHTPQSAIRMATTQMIEHGEVSCADIRNGLPIPTCCLLFRDRHTCTWRISSISSADDGSTNPSTVLNVLASLMASSGPRSELSPAATEVDMFGRRDITSAYQAQGGNIVLTVGRFKGSEMPRRVSGDIICIMS